MLHVLELQAGQGRQVGVGLGVEPSRDEVDDLDRAALAGAGLEQFLLAAADRPVAELPLDDLQALLDLVLVHAGAVAAQEELADVGRAPGTGGRTSAPDPCGRCTRRRRRRRSGRGDPVSIAASQPPTVTGILSITAPESSSRTSMVAVPSRASFGDHERRRTVLRHRPGPAERGRRVGGLVPQVYGASVHIASNLHPAPQPGPLRLVDFRGVGCRQKPLGRRAGGRRTPGGSARRGCIPCPRGSESMP